MMTIRKNLMLAHGDNWGLSTFVVRVDWPDQSEVSYSSPVISHAADHLHSRPWALYWLDRFSKKGVEGPKERSKSGRPTEITKEVDIKIRSELLENKQDGVQNK